MALLRQILSFYTPTALCSCYKEDVQEEKQQSGNDTKVMSKAMALLQNIKISLFRLTIANNLLFANKPKAPV